MNPVNINYRNINRLRYILKVNGFTGVQKFILFEPRRKLIIKVFTSNR